MRHTFTWVRTHKKSKRAHSADISMIAQWKKERNQTKNRAIDVRRTQNTRGICARRWLITPKQLHHSTIEHRGILLSVFKHCVIHMIEPRRSMFVVGMCSIDVLYYVHAAWTRGVDLFQNITIIHIHKKYSLQHTHTRRARIGLKSPPPCQNMCVRRFCVYALDIRCTN